MSESFLHTFLPSGNRGQGDGHPNRRTSMGSVTRDNGGLILNVLVDSPPHTLDRLICFCVATAHTPSETLIACAGKGYLILLLPLAGPFVLFRVPLFRAFDCLIGPLRLFLPFLRTWGCDGDLTGVPTPSLGLLRLSGQVDLSPHLLRSLPPSPFLPVQPELPSFSLSFRPRLAHFQFSFSLVDFIVDRVSNLQFYHLSFSIHPLISFLLGPLYSSSGLFLRSSSNLTRFRVRGEVLSLSSPSPNLYSLLGLALSFYRDQLQRSSPYLFSDISLPFPDTAVLGGNFTSSSTTMVISSSGGHPNGVLSPFTTNTGAPSACVISMSASRNLLFRFTRLYVSSLINDTDAPVSTKAPSSLPPISALQDSSFSCFLFRCPGLLQNQHLLVGQLAAKWPARPHVQHFALSLFNWVGLCVYPRGNPSSIQEPSLLILVGHPSSACTTWPGVLSYHLVHLSRSKSGATPTSSDIPPPCGPRTHRSSRPARIDPAWAYKSHACSTMPFYWGPPPIILPDPPLP
ncbi:unnamed protein product [Acanthosepion pharaonis]|uniref:Uncharacterized protein n=1 Tax=Acanthosepion pharaonis TaxID=158019 RepID=A0A812E0V8_ACAPH|nr:unnamed protein product [Sepia pharaonis]